MCRYLRGSIDYALSYSGESLEDQPIILEYVDADYAANIDKRRSTSGYVFRLWNSTISWKSSLQHVVALSTTEA